MALTEPRIVLDTNALYFLGGRLTNSLPKGDYCVSLITEIELLSYPGLDSIEETQILRFLGKVTVVQLDVSIKKLAIKLRKNCLLKLLNAIIAATAKSLNATLLNNDSKLLYLTEIHTQSVQIL